MSAEKYASYPYKRVALEFAVGALISRSSRRFLRRYLPPSLPELAALTRGLHGDPDRLLASTSWLAPLFSTESLAELAIEHGRLQVELEDRYETRQLTFPTTWAVEAGTSFLLYSLVRGLRPSVVIEMGVGNGHSSYYILRALRANGEGKLYSFDVVPEAGGLLADDERGLWQFLLIDCRRRARSLVAHLDGLPRADLCFHDADHGYLAQYFEFACLWAQLGETGILVSDDVDASYGLIDFCRLSDKQPEILIDGRKAIGVLSRARE